MRAASSDTNGVMAMYGQVATRTSLLYAIGVAGVLPIGIVGLAVTTRYLEPSDFGQLAALLAVSSILTVLGGIGILQGMMMAAYRMADDGDGDGADVYDEPVEDVEADTRERRRLLGSGVLLCAATSAPLCLAVVLVAEPFAVLLLGSGDFADSVRWMAVAAWTGSVWRTVHQVYRMERRPIAWSVMQWLRPGLVVVGSVYALGRGLGVNGILIATAAGTTTAILVALIGARHLYIFRPHAGDLAHLWNLGKRWIPLILAAQLQGAISVLVLTAIAPASSVGLYAAASRIAAIPIYFADGYLMGWGPLERSPIARAGREHKGARPFAASVFTLFALLVIGLMVLVGLSSDALIQVAAPSYASAAALIPVLAVGSAGFTVFRGLYRAFSFPRRRFWYVMLHLIWLLPFAGSFALLRGILDPIYAVAVANVVASSFIALAYVWLDGRGETPTPIPWTRLGAAAAVAGACMIAVRATPLTGSAHLLAVLAALAAFPLLLVATGGLPRVQLRIVRTILSRVLPRPMSRRQLEQRLSPLSRSELGAVTLIARDGHSASAAAAVLQTDEAVALARLVRGLRRYVGLSVASSALDHEIGEYVVARNSTLERDGVARHLIARGVDPVQLHVLDDAMRDIGRAWHRRRRSRPGANLLSPG